MLAMRIIAILLVVAGCVFLNKLSTENAQLDEEVRQLETEFGSMAIDHTDRIHLVEIKDLIIPPEIAPHVLHVWQFRCYVPPAYDLVDVFGGGQVSEIGVYQSGEQKRGVRSSRSGAFQTMITVSIQKTENALELYYSFGGWTGSTSILQINPDRFDSLVIQKLVSSDQGPRSFSRDTILPLLKIYDPNTAVHTPVPGKSITTYAGGIIVLCPQDREAELDLLLNGEYPIDFDLNSIAKEVFDE